MHKSHRKLPYYSHWHSSLTASIAVLCLSACGGASDSTATGNNKLAAAAPPGQVAAQNQLQLGRLEFAQSHVIPEQGRSWQNEAGDTIGSLHLTGARDTLVMLEIRNREAIQAPKLEVWMNQQKQTEIALKLPKDLPPTEDQGAPYARDLYHALIPANYVKPGMSLRVVADNLSASAERKPLVGADSDLETLIVPMYLFGANDNNTAPFASVSKPDQATFDELYMKWPVARLSVKNHAIKRLDWPYFIVSPDGKNPAYRIENSDQQREGYAAMGSALGVLEALQAANGEFHTNNQLYAPLMMLNKKGEFEDVGGGLGGGTHATGDHFFSGVFIHEVGHGLSLPHAGEAYNEGAYPYIGGSLLGSAWGFDSKKMRFMTHLVPVSAEDYQGACIDDPERIKDQAGRCVKQDPMQGGGTDRAKSDIFGMFSDFNVGQMQRFMEGKTRIDDEGQRVYEGGRIFTDANSATGYSRWDSLAQKRVPYQPKTDAEADQFGFDNGFPSQRNVPVQTIFFSISRANTAGVTQIFPIPGAYTGNLRRLVDPTKPEQLKEIHPQNGKVFSYCHASGCDYSLRISYEGGQVQYVMLQMGKRAAGNPSSAPPANFLNPKDGDSFRIMAVNVSAAKRITKVELLDTPMAWKGISATAKVLASR